MPAWITSLLREEMPLPIPDDCSAITTSWPASAAARATTSPMTPAPMTRICMEVNVARMERSVIRVRVAACRPTARVSLRSTRATSLRALLRRDAHLRRGGLHVGVHLAFEAHEIVAEHAHQLARGLVEVGLVAPGLERIEQVRLDARHGSRHREPEIRIRAERGVLERAVERGGEQRARHLDRHAPAGAEFAPGPAGVDQPAIDRMRGDELAQQV